MILENGECYSLEGLAIGGKDLEALGFRGPRIGELLKLALNKVIDGEWKNDAVVLLSELEKLPENQ
jgi:tRNA nucleotidyltransferase (CCA-adding enzyme)